MKLSLIILLIGVCHQSCAQLAGLNLNLGGLNDLTGNLVKVAENLINTITTQVFGQGPSAISTCAKTYGISANDILDSIENTNVLSDRNKMCAVSCGLEQSKYVVNGQLSKDMLLLYGAGTWGATPDVLGKMSYIAATCNAQVGRVTPNSCEAAKLLQCNLESLPKVGLPPVTNLMSVYRSLI